ncbi:threonine synthase [Alkaliphilus peptidifermentans]|uniref:Threonine synthase n=1 Tax=Alkaliphilus peptidifermentans DSM 18978 TaxID=1120976 RepID=A0A1G5FLC4_9FIRM|nr:threonine synthase [Alkaliphilus peptidifermentans]SCY40056.1 L-threonine synthase [Alkaliphilus peptidifermentans DSM 18978]
MRSGIINTYKEMYDVLDGESVITLQEGNTPLLLAENISRMLGKVNVYLKYEGLNPTGSFKDRGMTMAVTKAVQSGSKAIICASTGNTSASAAAYAAKANIKCFVLIPNNKIAVGKLAQAIMYGATILPVEGNFDDALRLVRDIAEEGRVTLVNSVNPHRLLGQRSGAYEVCDQLEKKELDYLSIPVGNAGNISAYWAGFNDYYRIGKIKKLPKMLGFQAEGAAPIVENSIVENPETVATAIRIGNPASWDKAVAARNESKGAVEKVTDQEILEAQRLLASMEGIFVEPASAASLAGVIKLAKEDYFPSGSNIVCILTGNGLKDTEIVTSNNKLKPYSVNIKEIKEAIYRSLGGNGND